MPTEEEINGLVLREKEKSLHISRIPRKTKEEFVAFAEEEFAGDYGMLIKWLMDLAKDSIFYKQNVDTKLNYIIQMLETEQSTASQEEEPEVITKRMVSGRILKKEVKK